MEIEKGKFLYMGIIKNANFVKPLIPKLVELGISINQIRVDKATISAQNGDYVVNLNPPDNPTELIIGKVKKTEQNNPQHEVDGQEGVIQYDPVLTIDFKPD